MSVPAPDAAPRSAPPKRLGAGPETDVVLFTEDDRLFVRKTALAAGANLRLRRQAIKQRFFAAQGFPFPSVRTIGRDAAGRAFFDMDYVKGVSLDEMLARPGFETAAVADGIAQMLWIFRSCVSGDIPAEAFAGAIAEVEHEAERGGDVREEIRRLAAELRTRDWSHIPASPSHGALTPGNILVSAEDGIIFIDCDEDVTSSYWLDLASLIADLEIDARRGAARESFANALRALGEQANARVAARLQQLAALQAFRRVASVRDDERARVLLSATKRALSRA